MFKSIKRHYHWIVAILVFLEMIVFGGLINSASVFIRPISESLGVKTTAYSVAMMPYTVSCFIGTSLSGFFFGRFGYKKTALVSLISLEEIMRKAQVAANSTKEPFTFYFMAALIYLGLTVIIMAALHWFEYRANRGYARTEL